ncbi:ABC-type Fe3+-siderophore transport system [Collimonas arenae]|uniref:ABC-type Fe3+-siderophore transport system n=1 Tax=Collimonas arenae TaxID=279058 RepID=A0A0A1F8B4_9BURK|nr:iron ABC transporter permease [Collimonas arenae]AIY40968.1 ABC-type Fe3+-siderophore transport system [Collimonas arenae]
MHESVDRPALRRVLLLSLLLSVPLLALTSMLVGAGQIRPGQALAFLLGDAVARGDGQLQTVLLSLRLPRMVAAVLVGGALGVAGMLMQSVTRNPLAEPGLLGVNAGAALGVVIGIAWAGVENGPGYLLWAGLGALLGNMCVLAVAQVGHHAAAPLRLVLAGVALGATFIGISSAILLSQLAGYDQYRFWVLGSLAGITPDMVRWTAPVVLTGWCSALLLARPLSALLLGDDIARSLGHRPLPVRLGVALSVTLLTGSAVALAGPIGFLGLLAPYLSRFLARSLMPPSYQAGLATQLLIAAWLGAALLLAADLAARLAVQPFETPISVMTALAGAPLLIWLARSRAWQNGAAL